MSASLTNGDVVFPPFAGERSNKEKAKFSGVLEQRGRRSGPAKALALWDYFLLRRCSCGSFIQNTVDIFSTL
jgi:hypothetical protein